MKKRKVAQTGTATSTPVPSKATKKSGDASGSSAVSVPSFGNIAPILVATATPRQRNISPNAPGSGSSPVTGFAFNLKDHERILATVKAGKPIANASDLAKVVDNEQGLRALCNMLKFETDPAARFASLKSIHDALNVSSSKRKAVVNALIASDVASACVSMLQDEVADPDANDATASDDGKSMAAFLLSSIAFQSPKQAAAVASSGAITPLVAMLSSPSPLQHKAAACTLAELLHDNTEGCSTLFGLGGVPKLINLLASSSASVRKWSLSVLLKMAHADVTEYRTAIVDGGAARFMVAGMRSNDPRIQETSAELVGQLAEGSPNIAALLVQQRCLSAVLHLLGCRENNSNGNGSDSESLAVLSRNSKGLEQASKASQQDATSKAELSGAPASRPGTALASSSARVVDFPNPPQSDTDINLDVADAGLFALSQLLRHGDAVDVRGRAVNLGVVQCLLKLVSFNDPGVASTAAKELALLLRSDAEIVNLLINCGGLVTLVSVVAQRLAEDDVGDSSESEDAEDEDGNSQAKDRAALLLAVLETMSYLVQTDSQVGVLLISVGGVSALMPLLRPDSADLPSVKAATELTLKLLPSVQAAAAMLQMKWTPADLRQEVLSATTHILCSHIRARLLNTTSPPTADSSEPGETERANTSSSMSKPRALFENAIRILGRLFAPRNQMVARTSYLALLLNQMRSHDACTREIAAQALQTLLDTCKLLRQKYIDEGGKAPAGTTKSLSPSSVSAPDFGSMRKLYQDDTTSDISISVLSEKRGDMINLKAHRKVLEAYDSAFFRSFTSNPNTPDVKIQGIDHEVFATVLKYLYTGEVELSNENVNALLLAGIRCDIKVLKEKCEQYHARQIRTGTFLEYLKLSSEISGAILRQRCLDFAATHIHEVADLPAFASSQFRSAILEHVGHQIVNQLQAEQLRLATQQDNTNTAKTAAAAAAAAGGGGGGGGSSKNNEKG